MTACEHGVDYSEYCDSCAHRPVEEWVGYPMTICARCIKPWPCKRAQELALNG